MSDDFQRLVHEADDPQVREVLGAGLHDGPSPEQVRRAAAALGFSAVTGAAAVAHASAGAGAATAGKSALLLGVLKWLGIGMLAGGITATASVAALSSHAASSHPAPSAAAVMRTTHAPAAPARVAPAPSVEPSAPEPARTAFVAAAPTASTAATPQASVARFDAPEARATLSDEIAMIDQARRALRSHDAAGALAALDRYQHTASKHALGAEALLLRVRALQQAGRSAEASRLGRSYIARHPTNGYAVRLRSELGIPLPSTPAPRATASVKVPTAAF